MYMEGTDVNLSLLIYSGTSSKSDKDTQPDFLPDKLKSSIINVVGLARLKVGINLLLKKDVSKVRDHEKTS